MLRRHDRQAALSFRCWIKLISIVFPDAASLRPDAFCFTTQTNHELA